MGAQHRSHSNALYAGYRIETSAKFCIECAAPLGGVRGGQGPLEQLNRYFLKRTSSPSGAPLEQHDVPEGKRKTVTALFADIKGSTERRNYLIALVIDWNCSNSCFRARSFISSGCVGRKRGS